MPKYNWDVQDRYLNLLNFKLEVILETRAYEISEKEKCTGH